MATALVATALRLDLSLVLEALDFRKKKAKISDRGTVAQNRMLASLTYGRIQSAVCRAAVHAVVKLVEVNPAWTLNRAQQLFSAVWPFRPSRRRRCDRVPRFSERINYVHRYRKAQHPPDPERVPELQQHMRVSRASP